MTPGNDKKVHEARLFIKGQSFYQAREILEFVIADEPGNLEALYLQALCFYYTRDYRRAENLLSQVCRQPEAEDWSALHKLYLISLLYQKKYNETELVARKTMIKIKDDHQLFNLLGYALEQQDKYNNAAEIYEEGLKLKPGDPSLQNSLAYVYLQMGISLDSAKDLIDDALNSKPYEPIYMHTLAVYHKKTGDSQAALQVIQEASRLQPTNLELQKELKSFLLAG